MTLLVLIFMLPLVVSRGICHIRIDLSLIVKYLDSQRKRYRIIILNDIWVEYSFRIRFDLFKFSLNKTDSSNRQRNRPSAAAFQCHQCDLVTHLCKLKLFRAQVNLWVPIVTERSLCYIKHNYDIKLTICIIF